MSAMPVLGTLGLITVNNDVFLCVVSGSVKVATVRPGETVQRIHTVEFREDTLAPRKGHNAYEVNFRLPQ